MIVLLSVVVLSILLLRWRDVSASSRTSIRGDVLLVFAHPDDEAMFFSPLLHFLREKGLVVHLLCLSNGGFGGRGKTREKELYDSAAFFGIVKRNVKVVDHPELRDGMTEKWSTALIRREVEVYLEKVGSVCTVVTFDESGVSSHPNHIAVHHAVKALKCSMPRGLIFLELQSKGILSKYSGIFSLLSSITLFSSHSGRFTFSVLIPPSAVTCSLRAMQKHVSQLVWFRYLFVVFSSYTFINDLSEM